MKLIFSGIKNGTIFEPEFQTLTPENGTIEFKHKSTPGGIAVVYAPNGTGKSSLTRVLGKLGACHLERFLNDCYADLTGFAIYMR